jgi:hypothetical protein
MAIVVGTTAPKLPFEMPHTPATRGTVKPGL